jgi:eukaryotic-like serine/threonine-protein kinase
MPRLDQDASDKPHRPPLIMNDWNEIEATFLRCLSESASEQAEILAECAARNQVVADQVRSMLAAHEQDPDFLEHRPRHIEPQNSMPSAVGPFKVISELGRGGMGTVYLARRDGAEFEQEVAIKLIRRGLDSDAVIDRFRRERKILARLEHPHIARFHDGGAAQDGTPYFVMEHVRGQAIDTFCSSNGVTQFAAIALFRKVCAAIHMLTSTLSFTGTSSQVTFLSTPMATQNCSISEWRNCSFPASLPKRLQPPV